MSDIPTLITESGKITKAGFEWLSEKFASQIEYYKNNVIELRVIDFIANKVGRKLEGALKKDGVILRESGAATPLQSFIENAGWGSDVSLGIEANISLARAIQPELEKTKYSQQAAIIADKFVDLLEKKFFREPLPEHSRKMIESLESTLAITHLVKRTHVGRVGSRNAESSHRR